MNVKYTDSHFSGCYHKLPYYMSMSFPKESNDIVEITIFWARNGPNNQ